MNIPSNRFSIAAVVAVAASVAASLYFAVAWLQDEREKTKHKAAAKQRLKKLRRDMALQKSALTHLNANKSLSAGAKDSTGLIKCTRDVMKWNLIYFQAQINVLNEVSKLSDDEKLETLFELLDVDESGNIDVFELVELRRKYSSYNGVYLDFEESLRISTRHIKSFDHDGDLRLDMDEFKVLVGSLAEKGDNTVPEMCELLVECLFCEDPEMLKNEIDDVQELYDFTKRWMDVLKAMYALFEQDEDGMIDNGHVQLLIAVTTAKLSKEPSRLTLDEMDEGRLGFGQFLALVFRSIPGKTYAKQFLECMHAMLVQITTSGGFEEWGLSPDTRGDLGEPATMTSSLSYPYLRKNEILETNSLTQLPEISKDPSLAVDGQAKTESRPTKASIRKSSTILHAAALTQAMLEREEISGITDLVKVNKAKLELKVVTYAQKLAVIQEFYDLDEKDRVGALFRLLDRNGDGKVNALELATGLKEINADRDFGEALRLAVADISIFDTDGDAMLDLHEFETYSQALAEKLGWTLEVMCEIILALSLTSEDDLKKELEEYSLERVTEHVKVQEAMRSGMRGDRLRALFGLLDIDACDSITCHEAFLGFNRIVDTVKCENRDILTEKMGVLDQGDGRINVENFTSYVFGMVCECAPGDPLIMFDSLVDSLTRSLLAELVPDGAIGAATA